MSEPESKTIMALHRSARLLRAIDFHSWGQLSISGFGCTKRTEPAEWKLFSDKFASDTSNVYQAVSPNIGGALFQQLTSEGATAIAVETFLLTFNPTDADIEHETEALQLAVTNFLFAGRELRARRRGCSFELHAPSATPPILVLLAISGLWRSRRSPGGQRRSR